MKLVTVPEMIAVEKAADSAGHSYADMMAAAGRSLAEQVHAVYGGGDKRLLAMVGRGNNGGDALVALVHLAGWGWRGAALLVGREPDEYVQQAVRAGWEIFTWPDIPIRPLPDWAGQHAVVLDGILGTGISLPLRGAAFEVLAELKAGRSGRSKLVAVDTPSGLDCSTGAAAPETPVADLTVAMAAAKTGFFAFPAWNHIGELRLAGIDLPTDLPAWMRITRTVLAPGSAAALLPARPLDGHKGTFGTAWIVGGSRRYVGAPLLAARGAFRAGAGLLATAVPESIYRIIAGHFPESTWLPLPEAEDGISGPAADVLLAALNRADAMAVGPGFGRSAPGAAFISRLLDAADRLPPLLVDADALRLLAGLPDWHQRLPAGSVLTPHPGEMAALVGKSVAEVQADRIAVAEEHARRWDQVVVLKGAFTIVAAPDGRTTLIAVATPALGRAGTGDVLSGIITGLLAQGLPGFEAAALGAYLHGRAGQLAEGAQKDAAAVLAGDVVDQIGPAIAALRAGLS